MNPLLNTKEVELQVVTWYRVGNVLQTGVEKANPLIKGSFEWPREFSQEKPVVEFGKDCRNLLGRGRLYLGNVHAEEQKEQQQQEVEDKQ